ncbi:hypothetical protein ASC77_09025 [Nocardioides sp. Root1257]|uniref:substrate-binding domain-containing protein n=1 Tax=unclassified Nocardioides TaxID=2615069 RepID=UPI0006F8D0BD|nr:MULTISPECIES: substrate-binding domain-containing protein [unclassified Nocardioides]KQW48858.1 hypothetical protein ASC77_09025 [Nocardioides sp. Root1257]KRC48033.1 hypothetical protein ASE24_09030 [Nocardioides sp. Root224]
MSKRRTAVAITVAGVVSAGALAAAMPSQADPAPTATDVVGVGSDIIQNSVDFLGDGYSWSGGSLPGYNTAGNKNRLISFSATADGNGRNAFTDPALGTSVKLNPTIVLRAGTSPVQRPNGGGAGLNALVADGNPTNGGRISFVRSPNKPTSAQSTPTRPLHTIQFADDKQYIATATTTNAPADLTTADLVKIYSGTWTTWGDVAAGVTPGAHTGETIVPLLPQDGAGVQTIFLNALKAANGGAAITLGGAVQKVQQNDPTTITALPDATRKNAIVPFPKGRYELLGAGYFRDPAPVYNSDSPSAALSNAGIKLQTGGSNFIADIPYYIVFRESDVNSSTPWQPGSTLNWVETLFYNPDYDPADPDPDVTPPFVASAAGKAIIQSIGLTPLYADHANTTTG